MSTSELRPLQWLRKREIGMGATADRPVDRAATPGFLGLDSRRRGTAAPCSCANCDSDSLRNIPAHTRGLRTEATRYRLLRMRVPVRGQRRKPDRSKSGVHAKKSTTGLSNRFSFNAGEAVARVAKCVDRAGEGTDGERRKGQRAQIV